MTTDDRCTCGETEHGYGDSTPGPCYVDAAGFTVHRPRPVAAPADEYLDCTCGHGQHAHDRHGKCTVGQRFAAMPVCPCDSFIPGIPIEVHRTPQADEHRHKWEYERGMDWHGNEIVSGVGHCDCGAMKLPNGSIEKPQADDRATDDEAAWEAWRATAGHEDYPKAAFLAGRQSMRGEQG